MAERYPFGRLHVQSFAQSTSDWGLDLEAGPPVLLLARDWHDWELCPDERPGRVRHAKSPPETGSDWREVTDDGLPRDSVALDQVPVMFLPWDGEVAVLASYSHGLWVRRLR